MSMIDSLNLYCVNERLVCPIITFHKIHNPVPMPRIHFVMVVLYFMYSRLITTGLRPNTITPVTKNELPRNSFCRFLGEIYPAFRDSQKLRLYSKLYMHVISRTSLRGILMKGLTSPGSTGHFKPMFAFLVPTTKKLP